MASFILQWNVGGLLSHLSEFKQHLLKTSPLIAAIQETHFRQLDVYNYNVPGYTLYRNDINLPNRQGGVALYISNLIPQRETIISSPLNVVAATVSLCHRDLLILSVYLPPNSPLVTKRSLHDLFSVMPNNCLVLGDFNAHHPLWGSQRISPRGAMIETEISEHQIIFMNDGAPTFMSFSYHTTSAIDLSLASPRIAPLFHWTVTSDPLFSDHFPIHIVLTCTTPLLSPPSTKKWRTDNADWLAFNDSMHQHAPYNMRQTVPEFLKAVEKAALETIQTRTSHVRTNRPTNAVWWNWRCQRAKAVRRRAFRNFQRCICEQHAELYRAARKECSETLRKEKQTAWHDFASKCNRFTPLKEIWGQVRAFSSRRNQIGAFPQVIIDNTAISEPYNVVNAFAKHFADISATAIYSPQVHQALVNKTRSLDFSSDNSESYNAPFTMRELQLSLAKASENTSVGPDGLPYSFFSNLDELNLSTLLIAFNNLWQDHTFPNEWLQGTIIPILKPGKNRQLINSYRPISLTNCGCKIFERMVNTRLRFFLEENVCLDAFQSGFRGHHSTADNIARLISDVQRNWERRNPTVAVFLDLTSAFNKVHRSTVIHKLHTLGIRGSLAHFLCNFLQPRSFKVRCQATLSDSRQMEHGVPQGSVLSPTLFLIAINDILLTLPRTHMSIRYSLFADDLAIWCSHKKCQDSFTALQKAIDHCVKWCENWGFFLSAPKSAMVVFKRGPVPDLSRSPQIENTPIPLYRSHKFLGITLDSHLTFQAHIEDVRTRCLKRVNVIRCLSGYSWGADRKTLLTLYIGIIRSILDYNCFLFSTMSVTLGKRLEAIQSTCLRFITGAFRTTPVLALRADSNIPALADRRLFLLLRYYLKAKSQPNHAAVGALEASRPNTRRPLRRPCFVADAVKRARRALDIPCVQVAPNPPLTPFWLYNDLSILHLITNRKAEVSSAEIQMTFQEYKNSNSESTFYFTDGSAHDNMIGSAAVGPNFRFSVRLPDYTTVFSAEVYAIKRVMLHIRDSHIPQATICTDSKSSIQALMRTNDFTHPGVFEIHQLVLSLDFDQHVTFLWIPGHCGIAGNDLADALAKEGASLPAPIVEPLALSDVLHLLNVRYAEYLQRRWEETHANHMYRIKPKLGMWVTCSQQCREREVILTRLRCGHTRLTHCHLFNRSEPPNCESCNMRISVEHILIGCDALTGSRQRITNYLAVHQLTLSLPTLLGNDDPVLTDLVLDFVLQSPYAGEL